MTDKTVGNIIKKIRKDNNLSQKDFAEMFNVSYQAVSKWENDKNIPDLIILKEISQKFNISLDEFFNNKPKTNNKILFVFGLISLICIASLIVLLIINNNNFEFKTISTTCDNFNVSGSIAYNKDKTSIYISHITYCGGTDSTIYSNISCSLYENNNGVIKEISSCSDKNNIKLEEFLKTISFKVDHYDNTCKLYKENTLFLEIEAINNEDKIIMYKIPLSLEDNC